MMGNQWVLGLHLIFFSVLFVATKYTCMGVQNSTIRCHERERLALLRFKHSVKDDCKMLSSWVGVDCCSWKGVRCDDATGHVISLHLNGNFRGDDYYGDYHPEDYFLVGDKVNSYLAELKHLKHLDLSGNDFVGSRIPEFIGSFKELSYLNLSYTGLGGIIPRHLGNLSNLKVLDLTDVDLFPAKNVDMVMYMLPSLTYLSLSGCEIYNDDLRVRLNSSKILSSIEHLDLSFNNFEGQLPYFFHNMTSLTFLDLSCYNLSAAWNSINLLNMIPSSIQYLDLYCTYVSPAYFKSSAHSNIQYLGLGRNYIDGRFPYELMNMTSLRVLDLFGNSLNSSVPIMPNLLKLDVSYNNFKHTELVGMWRQCHLKELRMSGNYFREEMIGPSTNNMSECSQYALEVLKLDNNDLNGSIPQSIGRLTNLRVLDLMSNRLTGLIPKALVRLRSLEMLDLSYNDLTGSIPTFHGKLTQLDLSWNQLCGFIPKSLGRLTDLTELRLQSNQLTGPIPVSMRQLSKLVVLDVSNNLLEGVVLETHFANLSMLKYLITTHNHKLSFNISHEWIPPFQLIVVELSSCKIIGGFPQWLQTQRKLEELVLFNASIHGLLPTWLRKMPIISYIDLSQNKLGGSLENLPFRNPINKFDREGDFLLLQDNLFNGSIPRSLCRRTRLLLLDVSRNKLSGNIPDCVENLSGMKALILSSNRLSGVLPFSLGNMSSLEWLKLNDNKFIGKFPRELGNMITLNVLDLGNNEFFGNIPKWIGENLTSLTAFRLHRNNFTGRIPQSLCKCSNLHILDVAHNKLTGSIPHCFGELNGMIGARERSTYSGGYGSDEVVLQVMKGIQLEYTTTLYLVFNMDLSSNKLIGQIPSEITKLVLLIGLNLSHNHLNGSIPNSIGNMKALNSLDLSDNQFTGMIPSSMATLNFLSCLDLSQNNLSGRIPTGNQLQTLTDPSIYAGNRDLCGAPLPNDCSNHENPPNTSKNNYKESNEPKNLWFYLDIACGFATGFWGIIGVLLFKKQWRHKLFIMVEVTMDKVHVAVAVRVSKIKRGKEAE